MPHTDPRSAVAPPFPPAVEEGGQIDAIARQCEHILDQEPDHPGASCLLGTIHARQGKFESAIPLLRRALARMPANAEGYNVLGMALRDAGQAEDAIACFRRAVAIRPDHQGARTNLGNALVAGGDRAGAIAQFRALLTLDTQLAAIADYRTALAADPADVETLIRLGAALRTIGRCEEAAAHFQAASSHAPDRVAARLHRAGALAELGRIDDAMACYQSVLDRDANNYTVLLMMGELLQKNERYAEAIRYLEQARALQPDAASVHAGLGVSLQVIGQIAAAAACFRRAIALAPDRLAVYLALTRIEKLTADDPILTALQERAGNEAALTDGERIDIHFALGKALSDIGRHRESFDHFLKGNALRRREIVYDENRMVAALRRTREEFSAGAIADLARTGHPSARPIFIVGMPRSGSTLVEQILASHPDVHGAGEVTTLADTFKDAMERFPAWRTIAPLAALTEAERLSVAEDYLRRLDALVPDGAGATARVTNKTLGNYFFIGLIRQLWPHASIIHTVRDPIDTCLSCFSIPFAAQDFSFDLGELGRRYRCYRDMMDHWRQVLPAGAMLDVRYEDVVADLEGSARRIVAYCGLPWDDACLRFHETRRPVKTSSMEQVRKPIYRSAVGRWRPDDATLRPLLDGLGAHFAP
ncbi:sulfotransferase [Gluconacetobacter diazotrophicus PA1 5]|uniref:tetratricopeptide repeat-containing sulfotransferase family protein n=1 Tax=Gluconacetobacter diazotrophicus TaxID=33996 RepID=UPI000173C172|nr:tetratricopeptide repeat-containing sulfotransferase family protein [Gluconacetobacter diazotrophicus]ACI51954.1 sulfotransferase [Gluconacetobacter diazotrophicus PA1 5]TWB05141.1 tetratricopeptide repeat protein [Gluconacetobacter diazotrophicus]